MIALLDTAGPAVWRASWQAVVLALVVMLLLRSLGERVSPRWRYRLWSVVVLRLLLLATPASPWSAFKLVRWDPAASARRLAPYEADPKRKQDANAAGQSVTAIPSRRDGDSVAKSPTPTERTRAFSSPIPAESALESMPPMDLPPRVRPVVRILSSVWLAGCLLSGLKLLGAALVLRQLPPRSAAPWIRMPPL